LERLEERYEEMVALLPEGTDLDQYAHGAEVSTYIVGAAIALGFDHPSLALDLDTPLDELVRLYAS